ncbi:MAG: 30S ribosome-binding factor RbfA [Candidatus Aminicenantes bacterium]|nr:30S ribosome-binding factor RbfA [Candidatus Aminicenantes bacterium]
MNSRRQKRVASLIKEELSRLLVEEYQNLFSGLITITRIEMSADLKSAYIYLSFYGQKKKEEILEVIEKKKGYLRKSIASKVKLKYNPKLIFSIDRTPEYEEKIEKLMKLVKKNEK